MSFLMIQIYFGDQFVDENSDLEQNTSNLGRV